MSIALVLNGIVALAFIRDLSMARPASSDCAWGHSAKEPHLCPARNTGTDRHKAGPTALAICKHSKLNDAWGRGNSVVTGLSVISSPGQ